MRRKFLLFLVVFCLVFTLSTTLTNVNLIQAQQPPTDKPGQVDKSKSRPTQEPQDFPDNELGRRLTEHFNLMVAVEKNAESRYERSLKYLQQEAPSVAKMLFSSYLKIEESRYFRRWTIVETLKELRNDSAFAFLQRIALTPIPPERFSDPESFSVDKESHIRVTAVDGIAELAKQGNKEAETSLSQFFTHLDLSVRRRAIRGYLRIANNNTEYERRVSYLKSKLPTKEHSLITLNVTNIKKVPHPDDVPDNLTAPQKKQDDAAPTIKQSIRKVR
jgi:inorganic triphosphatase YgiF